MGIHLLLGSIMATIFWMAAPYLASRIGQSSPAIQSSCLWCLRIAGLMTFARAIESVCISTQRAFQRYGAAVRVSVLARLLSLATAAALTTFGQRVVSILAATAVLTGVGLCLQLVRLKELLHAKTLLPYFDPQATNALFKFGIFSWLLATSGVLFSQADKLIGGVSFGAAAIASYALCAQMAQPIYGLAASGLHFLFPYLSGKRVTASSTTLTRAVLWAFTANVTLVLLSTLGLLLFGNRILLLWGGDAIARSGAPLLPIVVWSSALLSLNVTGSYAMLALGRVQAVTWLNLAAGGMMLLLIAWLLPRYGMIGFAEARLIYGMITLLIYIPLALHLRPGSLVRLSVSTSVPTGEEA